VSETNLLWRGFRLSDRELLLAIGRSLRHVYADTLRQPVPQNINALLRKIGQAERDRNRQEP
jgi:hypothetical protein